MVAERTGRRVRATPELVRGARSLLITSWRVVVDAPVTVRTSATGRTVETQEFHVVRIASTGEPERLVPAVVVASAKQVDEYPFRYVMPFTVDEQGRIPSPLSYGTSSARRRAQIPVVFEAIEMRSEGQ
jgi:hypothetical protein